MAICLHDDAQHCRGEEPASELIDRALRGEPVVITRRGEPVIELKPVQPAPRPTPKAITRADIEWLRARRVGRTPAKTDAGTLVSQMRDEEWQR